MKLHIPRLRKVHPNASTTVSQTASGQESRDEEKVGLTVWRKSLVFNCSGFTVFDSKGDLAFRVDSYRSRCCKTLLMDAFGAPLFTIRSRATCLGLGDRLKIYKGETSSNPLYVATQIPISNLLSRNSSQLLARVNPARDGEAATTWYEVEGSYAERRCSIYRCYFRSMKKVKVAEMKEKEAVRGMKFGCDVYRLIVWSGLIESSLAMAIVIVLDLMFRAS